MSSVSFHPSGKRLLSVSEGNSARIWDVPTFSRPTPDWLIALADILALESVPHEEVAIYAAIAKFSSPDK